MDVFKLKPHNVKVVKIGDALFPIEGNWKKIVLYKTAFGGDQNFAMTLSEWDEKAKLVVNKK